MLFQKSVSHVKKIFTYWQNFKCETSNQKICRMLLSVHSKSSRLAVLGELGRYPLFVRALTQCLAYKSSLTHKSNCSMAGLAMQEMADMAQYGNDCWLSRVQTIEKHIKLPSNLPIYNLSRKIYQHIKSRFDIFGWTK